MPSSSNSTTLYSNGGHSYTLSVSFEETIVDVANNQSTVSCTASLIPISNYWETTYTSTLSVYWHDNKENVDRLVSSITFAGISSGETKTATGTRTVSHKEDGTLSGYAYAYFTKGQTTSSFAPNSGGIGTSTIALTPIDRYPMILTAPDFNDEESPTVTFSTSLGFSNATVEIAIKLSESASPLISYRQVDLQTGSYTFNFTQEERNTLRNATPNSNNLEFVYTLRTTVGNDVYFSHAKRQMTIINAQPTLTYSDTETNQKVIDVIGYSYDYVIENASILEITALPTALKGASISSVTLRYGTTYRETKTTSPYVFTVPIKNSNEIIFDVVDSRGSNLSLAYYKNLINYTPVSFALDDLSFERDNPTSSDIIVNFEGNYLQTTFGSTANVPTIKWKLGTGSYTTIPSTEYTIDTTNNKITITNYELSNALDYREKGTFWLELSDLLTSASNSHDVLPGIPTFDYGKNDLKVNGDLFIADTVGENSVNVLERIQKTILWENQSPTSAFTPQNITLSSSDYDMLLWMFLRKNDEETIVPTIYSPKGYSVLAFSQSSTGLGLRRGGQYLSDTSFSMGNCVSSSGTTDDNSLIPLYVIGIKTGLF